MDTKNFGHAFAPAHISGIFVIDLKKDAAISGSMGCGVCLEDGAVTKVYAAHDTTIRINGTISEAPTTMSTIRLLTEEHVLVDTSLGIPVGAGFGASGAGALSTALALNEALSLNLTLNDLARAAHIAEVTNRTCLGDVAGQTCGGIDIRKKPGVPPVGMIDRIPCKDLQVLWVSFGEISTRSVLSNDLKRKTINKIGKSRLKEFIKKPTLLNFFRQSSAFAREIELMSPRVKDAIEAVEACGGLASQAMLGNTVFAINSNEALYEFGEVHVSRISHAGAHLL